MDSIIETHEILKDLHKVLIQAKRRFSYEYLPQEIKLNDAFKIALRNYLVTKDNTVEYFDYTTVVTNKYEQQIYIANQWFVIASFFVDFCSEMQSYRALFEKICRKKGMDNSAMKSYATRLKTCSNNTDKIDFVEEAVIVLQENYPGYNEDYQRVATYLWKFASDYSWWAGNKTIDRHDFYMSPLLNQMNTVNNNAEFLAVITLAYSTIFKLRLLINDIDNFTVGAKKRQISEDVNSEIQSESQDIFSCEDHSLTETTNGISISAASLERFQTM